MSSCDDPSELLDAVTAEIEAIIQEEINSQNAPVEFDELDLHESEEKSEAEELIDKEVEEIEKVQQGLLLQRSDEEAGEAKFAENDLLTDQIQCISVVELIEEAQSVFEVKKLEETQSGKQLEEIQPIFEEKSTELQENKDSEPIECEKISPAESSENKDISNYSSPETVGMAKETELVDFIEYTVNISCSPSKEKENETVVEIPAVPVLIESILNDAPIDENDGPRAKHFKQALRKALNNTVKSCSGEKLEACFPFNLKANQFSQINSTIINALKSVIDGVQVPFDEFLKSENLVDKLNKVDEFTRSRVPGTSESSEAAIIASLTPQNLIDRKLYNTKLSTLSKLEQFAQKLESENSQLASVLNNRQTEFADRLDRLKSSQQLLDAALEQISTISMHDLEVLVDKMNYQYQPSALKFHN